jgi:hypothetical protein
LKAFFSTHQTAMEGAIKEQIDELNRCRADYSALFQNFKQARAIFEEKDRLSCAQLQLVLTKNEALQRKVEVQKETISAQKLARKGFENDVNQLKYATDLLEVRERCIYDKHEGVSAENTALKLEVKAQTDLIGRLLADLERVNSTLSNETVPKVAIDRLNSEIETLKRKMKEEMITLEVHQHVKEKYADLQCRVEWGMIALEEYNAVATNIDSLTRKLEGSVSRQEFTQLLDKYQKVLAEKVAADESIENSNVERENAERYASEAKSKFLALEAHLEKTEKDLIASKISEDEMLTEMQEARYDLIKCVEEKKQGVDRNKILESSNRDLLSQLESMKVLLDKELESIRHLEKANKALKETSEKEKTVLRGELEGLRRARSEQIEALSHQVESEQSRSSQSEERANALHAEDMQDLRRRTDLQLEASQAELESIKLDCEARCVDAVQTCREEERVRVTAICEQHLASDAAHTARHEERLESLRQEHCRKIEEVLADRQQYLESALVSLQTLHGEEMRDLSAQHDAATRKLREEISSLEVQKRKEEINCDLERIRADTAEDELAAALKSISELSSRAVERERVEAREREKGQESDVERKMDIEREEKEKLLSQNMESERRRQREEIEGLIRERLQDERDQTRIRELEREIARGREAEIMSDAARESEMEREISRVRELERESARVMGDERLSPSDVPTPTVTATELDWGRPASGIARKETLSLPSSQSLSQPLSQATEESCLLEITRSLEGCSLSQLVHIAARGVMRGMVDPPHVHSNSHSHSHSMSVNQTPLRAVGQGQSAPQHSHTLTHTQGSHPTPDQSQSLASMLSTFDSPSRSVYPFIGGTRENPFNSNSTPVPLGSSILLQNSPGPFLSYFDPIPSPLVPNFTGLQQMHLMAPKHPPNAFAGMDFRQLRDNESLATDRELNSADHTGNGRSRSRGNSAGPRGGAPGRRGSASSNGESTDFSPPRFTTSPLVTPYQSISLKPGSAHSGRRGGTNGYSNDDAYNGHDTRNPHPGSLSTPALSSSTPGQSSREELLDRLISLTKEARFKIPIGLGVTPDPPL